MKIHFLTIPVGQLLAGVIENQVVQGLIFSVIIGGLQLIYLKIRNKIHKDKK